MPSGLLWATYNVGANKPEEIGLYFRWGATQGFTSDDASNFSKSSYCSDGSVLQLSLDYDSANAYMGNDWRMPNKKEAEELRDSCKYVYTTINDVPGSLLISNKNPDKSIFLPNCVFLDMYGTIAKNTAIGCYWVSEADSATTAYQMMIGDSYSRLGVNGYCNRQCGLNIRPVFQPS